LSRLDSSALWGRSRFLDPRSLCDFRAAKRSPLAVKSISFAGDHESTLSGYFTVDQSAFGDYGGSPQSIERRNYWPCKCPFLPFGL